MPGPSVSIILTMLVLLGAASGVFWLLTRRWVHGRQMGALYDWARANGMRVDRKGRVPLPQVITQLAEPLHAVLALHDGQTLILQLRATPSAAQLQPPIWQILVRPLPMRWPATALRPVEAIQSFLDLFALPAIPGLLSPERFTVHGEDRHAAAQLAHSPLGAQLPADIGLLLIGDYLILDFSTRPFDGTEFTRLLTVTDQLFSYLRA